jgi:hypothetical protein
MVLDMNFLLDRKIIGNQKDTVKEKTKEAARRHKESSNENARL